MSLHTGTSVYQFPESDKTGDITEGAESSSGTAAQNHGQSSVKVGSAAARFKIRSAKTLQRKFEPTTKDLKMISNIFEGGKVEDSNQKSDSGKDLNKVCVSSASGIHTDINVKNSGQNNGTCKDSALSISLKKGDVSAKQSNTQEEESPTASDRSRGEDLRRFYQTNKSKSLDWREMNSRAGHRNTTEMTSGTRDFNDCKSRSGNFERTGANNKFTPYTQENKPSSVLWRIQAYSGANQNADRKIYPISGSTSVRMSRVNFALEQASSGQSLPVRLKPRLSQGSIGEESSLWVQQQGESSPDRTDNRMGFSAREQEPSNIEEVTGNQSIMERIEKLFGADSKSDAHSKNSIGLKRKNTLTYDKQFAKSIDIVDSTPSHRKYTTDSVFGTSSDTFDSQQGKPSYNIEKARSLPRGFSKTYLVPKQEPSTNRENKTDQRDNSSGINFSISTGFPVSQKYCGQSVEGTKIRPSTTAQYCAHKNQSVCSDSSSSISSQGVKHLLNTYGGIKEEIGIVKQSDKESTKRLDINENKYLDDGITQPKYPLTSKGAAHNEIQKEEEKDEVFTDKTEGRREGVLEKNRVAFFDSVKNTISMFESLSKQSKSIQEILLTKRTLSVPEHPKPVAHIKKSDSDKNLYFRRCVGHTETNRSNFFNKSYSNEETESTIVTRRSPDSNPIVKVRPTLEHQETNKKSVELAPAFKQMNDSRTDQVINMRDGDKWTTVSKKQMDEPDSAIAPTSGLRNKEAMEEKAGIPSISQQSNVKNVLKQQTINVKIVDENDDENTPTNSPNSVPLTVSVQNQINPGAITVNGTHQVLPNLSQSPTPVQTTYSLLNNSNNNNYDTRNNYTILTTSKARWSSDEEDDDEEEIETEEDSDSGESSVTITSNMSQSERRSFSLSLVDLCNFGGVDYKPSDDSFSEDGEDVPSTRSASLSSDISAFSSVTLLSTDELDRLLDDVRGLGDETLEKYEDVQVVVLHKEVGSGLGFTLAGGVDQNKSVTVHRVIPGGVAAVEGSIFEGARVLSINGTALQNSAHGEALRTLRKARGQGMAVVVLQSGNSQKEATERPGITGRRVRVTLKKSSSDLGFSLEGGVGSSSGDKPITVQKVFHGGPVSEVFPGDELLEVQGRSLAGLMRLEAWNLIKKLPPGPVEVLLHRPHQPR